MKVLLLLVATLAFTQAQTTPSNITSSVSNITSSSDALAYLLNLKYLQGQFYTFAVNGSGLDATLLGFVNATLGNVSSLLNGTIPANITSNATSIVPVNGTSLEGQYSGGQGGSWWNKNEGLGQILGIKDHGYDNKSPYPEGSDYPEKKDFPIGHDYPDQKDYPNKLGLGDKQGHLDGYVGKIGKIVSKDILSQDQFMGKFKGGELASLTWFVQQIAEQLAWGETQNIKAIQALLGELSIEAPALAIGPEVFGPWMKGILGDDAGWKGEFNPFADDISFVLAAYFFENLILEAEWGLLPLLKDDFAALELLTSIIALDSHHAGCIRNWLWLNGALPCQLFSKLQVIEVVQKIADWTATFGGCPEGLCTTPYLPGFWVPKFSQPNYQFAIAATDQYGILGSLTPIEVATALQFFFPQGFLI